MLSRRGIFRTLFALPLLGVFGKRWPPWHAWHPDTADDKALVETMRKTWEQLRFVAPVRSDEWEAYRLPGGRVVIRMRAAEDLPAGAAVTGDGRRTCS